MNRRHEENNNLQSIDINQTFPLLPTNIMERICAQAKKSHNGVRLYLQIRYNDEKTPFVDIYVFDADKAYQRFIVTEKHILPIKKESYLINYVQGRYLLLNSVAELRGLDNQIQRAFEKWNYPYYSWCGEEKYAIEHICSMSHASPKETLYKAHLPCIAYHLSEISHKYDPAKASPSEILNLPLKLLRILDNDVLVERLFSEESKLACLAVYRKFCSYIDRIPSPHQWRYLEEIYTREQVTGKCFFSRTSYDRLFLFDENKEQLATFNEFEKLRSELSYLGKIDIPNFSHLQEELYRLKRISCLKADQACLDPQIKERSESSRMFECSSDKWMLEISVFKDLDDILRACMSEKTCLPDYVIPYTKYKNMLLAMRHHSSKKICAIIDVEYGLDGRYIAQFRSKLNRFPSKDCFLFLEEWCQDRSITFEPDVLLMQGGTPLSDELLEYALYKQRERRELSQTLGISDDFLDINLEEYEFIDHTNKDSM